MLVFNKGNAFDMTVMSLSVILLLLQVDAAIGELQATHTEGGHGGVVWHGSLDRERGFRIRRDFRLSITSAFVSFVSFVSFA